MRFAAIFLLFAFAVPVRAEPLKVVASFSILADIVQKVGGAEVNVTSLVGPEADAHGFEARPSDAKRLATADVLVVNGLGFDDWAGRLADAAGFKGKRIVASAHIAPIAGDPHAWQSVPNAISYVDAIAVGLSAADPKRESAFRSNADIYKTALKSLDLQIHDTIAAIPEARRRAIVPHEAFDYFARDYGIAFLAPLGTDAEAHANAGRVAELIAMARAGKIGGIFAERLSDRRLVERVAEAANMGLAGVLYSDALSRPDGPAGSYIALMQNNLRVIAAGLTTEAPRAR